MAAAVLFLDVDGVMHPLGANYLPLHTPSDAECADAELIAANVREIMARRAAVRAGSSSPRT